VIVGVAWVVRSTPTLKTGFWSNFGLWSLGQLGTWWALGHLVGIWALGQLSSSGHLGPFKLLGTWGQLVDAWAFGHLGTCAPGLFSAPRSPLFSKTYELDLKYDFFFPVKYPNSG
jgi:hypothetical protein